MANVDKVAYTTDRSDRDETGNALLGIGQFARRSRLSTKALRLYERRGLLVPADVDPANGYRRYQTSQLATARLIATLRRLDMPLADVAKVVAAPDRQAGELVAAFWAAVEQRVAGQRELAMHLRIRLTGATEAYDMFEIRQRDVPDQLVLVEQRHIKQPELTAWMGAGFSRLVEAADRLGGAAGPALAIYHGEVNEDSDGPVELAVPIDSSRDPGPGVATRVETAHREAFVRIKKALVAYPQILTAFDAVEHWISGRDDLTIAGSPREIYFTDFMTAGPDDEVCDVAFPISTSPAEPARR